MIVPSKIRTPSKISAFTLSQVDSLHIYPTKIQLKNCFSFTIDEQVQLEQFLNIIGTELDPHVLKYDSSSNNGTTTTMKEKMIRQVNISRVTTEYVIKKN